MVVDSGVSPVGVAPAFDELARQCRRQRPTLGALACVGDGLGGRRRSGRRLALGRDKEFALPWGSDHPLALLPEDLALDPGELLL